jgi:hypothetical protein
VSPVFLTEPLPQQLQRKIFEGDLVQILPPIAEFQIGVEDAFLDLGLGESQDFWSVVFVVGCSDLNSREDRSSLSFPHTPKFLVH